MQSVCNVTSMKSNLHVCRYIYTQKGFENTNLSVVDTKRENITIIKYPKIKIKIISTIYAIPFQYSTKSSKQYSIYLLLFVSNTPPYDAK